MKEILPVAKLGDQILLINRDDLEKVGTEKSLEVMSINVYLKYKHIDEPTELEKHLKFNPWDEVDSEEAELLLDELTKKFAKEEIEKILNSL